MEGWLFQSWWCFFTSRYSVTWLWWNMAFPHVSHVLGTWLYTLIQFIQKIRGHSFSSVFNSAVLTHHTFMSIHELIHYKYSILFMSLLRWKPTFPYISLGNYTSRSFQSLSKLNACFSIEIVSKTIPLVHSHHGYMSFL